MGAFIQIMLNAALTAWFIFIIATADASDSKWKFAWYGAMAMWCFYDFVKYTYRAVVGIR